MAKRVHLQCDGLPVVVALSLRRGRRRCSITAIHFALDLGAVIRAAAQLALVVGPGLDVVKVLLEVGEESAKRSRLLHLLVDGLLAVAARLVLVQRRLLRFAPLLPSQKSNETKWRPPPHHRSGI